jgi:small-conductance mechanosensitive channel
MADVAIRSALAAAIIFVAAVVFLFTLRRVVVSRLATVARRTETEVDDLLVDLVRRTRAYFLVALSLAAASRALTIPDAAQDAIRLIAHVAAFFQVGAWGNTLSTDWIRRWAARRGADDVASATTISALAAAARFVLWTILVLFALRNAFGFDITALITGLGIGGVAIALAVQNVLGDIFAAVSIVVDKPFVVGNTISVDNLTGHVEHIGIKTTRLRSVNGEELVFANADLLKSRLRNWSRMRERRVVTTFGVTYDTPPSVIARIPGIVSEIIAQTPKARFERCHFARFESSSLVFETAFWVTTPEYLDYMDALQAVNLAILARFTTDGIEFAFPTQTVRVHPGSAGSGGAVPGATVPVAPS